MVFEELRDTVATLTQPDLAPETREVLQSHVGCLYDLLTRMVACPTFATGELDQS